MSMKRLNVMYSVFSDIQFITCVITLPCWKCFRANVVNYYKVHTANPLCNPSALNGFPYVEST